MKIMIDPVYTARASTCSTSYLAWQIIKDLCEWRPDVFFYLMCPEEEALNEDDVQFLARMPDRVKLIRYPYVRQDRMEELYKFTDPLRSVVTVGEQPYWDYDAILTSRIPQMQNFRVSTGRSVPFGKGSYQAIIGLEEMPVFSFRDTVAWGNSGKVDLQSLAAYQASDAMIVNNLWTKQNVLQVARQWLSPSKVMDLEKLIHEVIPVKLDRLKLAPKEVKDTLNVVFCGRMTGTRNFVEVAELFRKHFSFPLNKGVKVRFIVSTHSESTGSIKVGEVDFIEFQHNNREQFHKLLKEEAHVVVNLSTVEDFSLSTYEPLTFGVPVIAPTREWADFLGKEYPFRVKDFNQSYMWIKEFANDYAACYEKFTTWEASYWKGLVESRANISTTDALKVLLSDHENKVHAKFEGSQGFAKYKEFIKTLDQHTGDLDVMVEAKKQGVLMDKDDWTGIPTGKRTNFYGLKVLLNMAGWTDTLEPGVMTAPVAPKCKKKKLI